MNTKNFAVYRSSAGSGKTYTLSLNYIALALLGAKNKNIDYYKKILAITFTNKAAAEMKERVLEYLEELSLDADKKKVEWLKENINITEKEIIENSKKVRESILHNYTDFRISTIDKFTYNIVRTFSSDLDLAQNFELEMDNYKIIQPVVSSLLSKMSAEGGALSKALVNFALQKAEDGKSANIENDLQEFTENLFKEEAIPYISTNISVEECMKVRNDLKIKQRVITNNIKSLSVKAVQFFNSYGFTKEHFQRGIFFNHFTKNINDEKSWTPTQTLQGYILNDEWYGKSKSDDIKDLVDLHKTNLKSFFTDLMKYLKDYNTINSILTNIYSIAVLNELTAEVNLYKKQQNIEQISVFNKKIHNVIVKQDAAFIYERIGERYNHFLIDEFQDTSTLQWQNILPLITATLDDNKCLIVGDGKQSIYRWRGGEVEQFVKIPKIFKGENLCFSQQWERKLEAHYIEPEDKNENYRSKKNIIDFNNNFYEKLRDVLAVDLKRIYENCKQNYSKAEAGGYIHLELINDENQGVKLNIIKKMIDEINKLKKDSDFRNKDIAILCNSRKMVSFVSQQLSKEDGIQVVSNDGLLLYSSDNVTLIVAVLKFMLERNDNLSKALIINFLQNRNSIKKSAHKLNLLLQTNDSFFLLLKEFGINLDIDKLLRMPLYEAVERIIISLKIKEDLFTQFFLDVVLRFSEKNGSSLTEFLQWWEDNKTNESIVVPEDADAVQVMTIHKAKGLAFNVVMIPFNWEAGTKGNNIWVDTSKFTSNKLKSALIRGGKKLEHSHFANENRKENELTLMDSLNKLYVATTRAKQRLYIYAKEYPKNIGDNFTKSGRLNSFLYLFNVVDKKVIGDPLEKYKGEKKKIMDLFNTYKLEKTNWEEVVSLKKSSEKYWDTISQDSNKDWGKLLHLALSRINNSTEIESVVKSLCQEGLCNLEQKLNTKLISLFQNKEFLQFFNEKWEVKNEREILLKDGSTYIPDRLLFSKTNTIVIDYKTGTPEDKHKKQIINYAAILQEMGYKNIEKYLVYTSLGKLVHKI
ncbi:MAG: UvrD-helicase domain-containing protein [Flavobacteriales bacterium]|nr:UvrD-helicase domain-containing protein [Flavobacteriales bacterium]